MIDINGAEKAGFYFGFKDYRLGSQPHKHPSTPPRQAALSTQSHTPSEKTLRHPFPAVSRERDPLKKKLSCDRHYPCKALVQRQTFLG
jgi:hypothetical protein